MNKVTIGIDPDSKAHGVAIYHDKKLVALECLTLMQIHELLHKDYLGKNVIFSIENVCATSAAFNARDKKSNQAVKLKMAQHIGQCKQSQIELERMLDYLGFKCIYYPISKSWKSQAGKKQFELVTGWKGRSNEDTRSAAYFGFLGLK
ncbi:MAG: hypothetical protein K0U08_01540 [Proteobacteria bacterium]|nr:hypothetical protein [Pseudomonadota bacterium]